MMMTRKPTEDTDDENEWEDLSHKDSDEDHDESSVDEEEEEEEEEETSWMKDFRESWKQHFIAILVAVIATAATHVYTQQQHLLNIHQANSGDLSFPAPTLNSALPPSKRRHSEEPHEHLMNYKRTANITFCNANLLDMRDTERLAVMDFHIPFDFLETMRLFFHADALEDDRYSRVLSLEGDAKLQHAEVDCMQTLASQASSRKKYIRGMTYYAKEPTIASMYPDYDPVEAAAISATGLKEKPLQAAHLTFTGFGAKFYNLSPNPVLLYWDGRDMENRRLLGEIPPMESLGTATTPGQSFSVTPVYDSDHALSRWVSTADEAVVYYDPEDKPPMTTELRKLYKMQKLNQEFAKHYLIHSRRTWLAQFPRAFPVHPIWEARYFGQTHSATIGSGDEERTVTLEVKSVTPKVLTIDNFLSFEECDTIIHLALSEGLHGSTVYAGSLANHTRDKTTRSSSNSWLARDTTALTDHIYVRAAQVLKMNPELFQKPIDDDVEAHLHSIAESLQVVRYKTGEEYTAHHDFVYPSQRHRYQPTRFATLLFYLNDDFEGGHTVFPRAVNKENHEGVQVKPKKGTAVLFYSMLEDGNVDDLSQHASQPVESGEKYIANLWLWDSLIN